MTSLGSVTKSAGATKDYRIDFSPYLQAGEQVTAAVYTADQVSLTIGGGAYASTIDADGKGGVVWLSAGTEGLTYVVNCHFTTDNVPPRIDDRTFTVTIENPSPAIFIGGQDIDAVQDYGADPNNTRDTWQDIQNALTAAAPGQLVRLRTGIYQCGSTLGATDIFTMPYQGVKLTGTPQGQMGGPRVFAADDTVSGAQLNVVGTGRLFTIRRNSCISNLTIYYPDQNKNSAPIAHGITFYIHQNEHHVTIENIVAINPYDFVSIAPTGVAGPTHIRHVTAWPLHSGIVAGRAPGVLLHEVGFNNIDSESGATLIAWVQANGTAYAIGGVEQFDITDCFAFGYRDGVLFENVSGSPFFGAYGSWKGGGLDQCTNCVRVAADTSLGCLGFKMSDAQIIPNVGGEAVVIEDDHAPASDAEKPWLGFDKVGVHQFSGHLRALRVAATSFSRVIWEKSAWLNMTVDGAANDSTDALVVLDKIGMPAGATRTSGVGTTDDLHPMDL